MLLCSAFSFSIHVMRVLCTPARPRWVEMVGIFIFRAMSASFSALSESFPSSFSWPCLLQFCRLCRAVLFAGLGFVLPGCLSPLDPETLRGQDFLSRSCGQFQAKGRARLMGWRVYHVKKRFFFSLLGIRLLRLRHRFLYPS